MSVESCSREIVRFLASPEPEVLVLSGRWGVGKTYTWRRLLLDARSQDAIALTKYSYVSLFGLESLPDVRDAIFENAQEIENLTNEISFGSMQEALDSIKSNWKKSGFFAKIFPFSESYANFIIKVGYSIIRRQIVCIDDLDRKSSNLDLRNILGLVSQLKEEKKCKVVMLLNDEQLGEDGAEFQKYLEKISDINVRFDPTPSEAAQVVFDLDKPQHRALSENCQKLGIVNIRTLQKILALMERARSDIGEIDPRVLDQAAHSIPLFSFTKFHPDDAPSYEFIKATNVWVEALSSEGQDLPHPEWRSLLTSYKFNEADEFDLLLMQGVQNGHFQANELRSEAAKLAEKFAIKDKDDSFSQAWRSYHDSFDDNAGEVMQSLSDAVAKTPQVVSPTNLSGTITLLKDLNWQGDIKQLIQAYIDGRTEDRNFWDLDADVFGSEVKDEDVKAAFEEKLASFREERHLSDILISWGSRSGYNTHDVTFISGFDIPDFVQVFKTLRGDDLSSAVRGALWFKGSADPVMKKICDNAEAALRQIGAESPINRRRVIQDGVSMEIEEASNDD